MTDLFDKFHPEPESFTAGVIEHRGGAAYPEFSTTPQRTLAFSTASACIAAGGSRTRTTMSTGLNSCW
jgi:hypothetical protein